MHYPLIVTTALHNFLMGLRHRQHLVSVRERSWSLTFTKVLLSPKSDHGLDVISWFWCRSPAFLPASVHPHHLPVTPALYIKCNVSFTQGNIDSEQAFVSTMSSRMQTSFLGDRGWSGGTYTGMQVDTALMQSHWWTFTHTHTHRHSHACEVVKAGLHCPLVSGNWLPKVFSIFTNKGSQAREQKQK